MLRYLSQKYNFAVKSSRAKLFATLHFAFSNLLVHFNFFKSQSLFMKMINVIGMCHNTVCRTAGTRDVIGVG